MVDPNWGLLQNNSLNYLNYGMQMGRDARASQDARELKAAGAQLFQNPDDPKSLANYSKLDPKGAFDYRQNQQNQAAQQQKAAQEKALMVAKLFDGVVDEASYQQRLSVAQRMGVDVAGAPPNFDPAWVQENGAIFKFFAEKPEALSTFGKLATDEGYQPGSPEFSNRVKELGKAEAFKIITPQPGAGAVAYNPMTNESRVVIEANDGMGNRGMGGGGELPRVTSPQEAMSLPPGSQFIMPDGRIGTVPGGASSNAGGGFRPVSDGAGIAKQVFPSARITSGYRGPDHPLSKANPDSYHTRTRAAADMAPIPGMTFAQAKAQFEARGYYVHPDSRDETVNPSSHATGPHWHFVIGSN